MSLFVKLSATRTPDSSRMAEGLRKDDDELNFETSEDVDVTASFDTMGLREDLIRGIYAYGKSAAATADNHGVGSAHQGSDAVFRFMDLRRPAGFERPSAIQQRAIKPITKGRDVIAQ